MWKARSSSARCDTPPVCRTRTSHDAHEAGGTAGARRRAVAAALLGGFLSYPDGRLHLMFRAALPDSRDARRILVGTVFSAIGRGLTLPFLFVYLNQVRGLPAGTVGLLVGWTGLVGLLLAPVGGTLVDRYGARRIVLPLFLVEAAGRASIGFVPTVPTALLALTAVAIGGARGGSGGKTNAAPLGSH